MIPKGGTLAAVEEKRTLFIRPDGKEKVTGLGRYTADMNLTGQLHAKFKYAGHTHARITRIDTSKAKALPGVFAVLTHADVPVILITGHDKITSAELTRRAGPDGYLRKPFDEHALISAIDKALGRS